MAIENRVSEAGSVRELFSQQWARLTQLLGVRDDDIREPAGGPDAFPDAVERIVEGTNAKLRVILGYKKRLRGGAHSLVEHVAGIVDTLPPPLALRRNAFSTDNQINAYFVSPEHITEVLAGSRELRDLLATDSMHRLHDVYALLFMLKVEKNVLGIRRVGDMLVRDVAQTTVSFTGHRLAGPSETEQEARSFFRKLLFERAVSHVRAVMHRFVSERSAGIVYPETYLSEVTKALEGSREFLKLERSTIVVTKLGIKAEEEGREPVNVVPLQELKIGEAAGEIVLLVVCQRSDVPLSRDGVAEAKTILGIRH